MLDRGAGSDAATACSAQEALPMWRCVVKGWWCVVVCMASCLGMQWVAAEPVDGLGRTMGARMHAGEQDITLILQVMRYAGDEVCR
jgi:hypothetical protein